MLNKIKINPKKQKLIVYIFLTVITFAVFWQVNQFDFINLDDHVYVTENHQIQSGITLNGLFWAFGTTHAEFWHPLTWLSLMLDYQLYGLNAGGYHITNLLLHIMSTLLLFWLFNRMTGAIWKSAFVAAFFALHPLHVESVAWIAERKDVLSAFFWMLTLCLYVYYTEKPVIRRYLLVLLCFACALMSKPMVVTLPIVMILLDYWPLGRLQSCKIGTDLTNVMPVSTKQGKQETKSEKETLKGNIYPFNKRRLSKTNIAGIRHGGWQLLEKTPFFVLSAVIVIFTLYAQPSSFVKHFPLSFRLVNAPVSFVTYLKETFWPHDLVVFYPFSNQLPIWQVMGAVLLILVISAAVIAAVKRFPYLLVGWLWYAITILPVIEIIQVGNHAMADRYTYIPSIGIAIMLAWGIPLLFPSENIGKKILFPAATIVLAILAVLTWQQCGYWKNSIELFGHALSVTKNNYLAHTSIAATLSKEGKNKEAIYHYNQSISIEPSFLQPYISKGIIHNKLGQYQLAIENFNEAIRRNPYHAEAYYNRGITYAKLGQHQRAIEDYSQAIRLRPYNAEAFFKRGFIYGERGQYKLALEDFNNYIRLNPDDANAYNNRGYTYTNLGQYKLAIENYSQAIRLKPDYTDAYMNRGVAYLIQGKYTLGCHDAQKACALRNCKTLESAKGIGLCR